jgi:hypothetical protein
VAAFLTGRFVDKQPIHQDLIELPFRVLVETADPDVTDAFTVHDVPRLQDAKVSWYLFDPLRQG